MKFTEEHVWLRVEGDTVVLGLTEQGIAELGEIVFIDLPEEGAALSEGDEAAVVEGTDETLDILAPLEGEVMEVNDALAKTPGLIADDPQGGGWLFALETEDLSPLDDYMDERQYKSFAG